MKYTMIAMGAAAPRGHMLPLYAYLLQAWGCTMIAMVCILDTDPMIAIGPGLRG